MMTIILRMLALLFALSAVVYAIIYFIMIIAGEFWMNLMLVPIPLASLIFGILVLIVAFSQSESPLRHRTKKALIYSFVLGNIGLAVGIIGPLAIGSGNQGPLLGFIFTGPLGVVIGAIVGALMPIAK